VSRHTPGPWVAEGMAVKMLPAYPHLGGGFDLRYCPNAEANARLISAAPDLLEALENIENDDGSIPATIWEMRNAAIAKARNDPA
jgi:hypothetical protein